MDSNTEEIGNFANLCFWPWSNLRYLPKQGFFWGVFGQKITTCSVVFLVLQLGGKRFHLLLSSWRWRKRSWSRPATDNYSQCYTYWTCCIVQCDRWLYFCVCTSCGQTHMYLLQAAQEAIAAGERRKQLVDKVVTVVTAPPCSSFSQGKRDRREVQPTPSTKVTPEAVKKPCEGSVTPRALSFTAADDTGAG